MTKIIAIGPMATDLFSTDRLTDRNDKEIAASRNFAKAPKKGILSVRGLQNSRDRNIRLQMNDHSM